MIKSAIYGILILLMAFLLSACGTAAAEVSLTAEGYDFSSNNPENQEFPPELNLMLGTVLLEGTDQAIDADQAAELLPLWKVLNSLSVSENAAQVEVDAVISSIEEAMTTDQMAAIDAMALTMVNTSEVMESLGLEIDFGARLGEVDPEMRDTRRESGEGPPEGFGPGGGLRLGGQGFGEADGILPEMRETARAERGGNFARGFGINTQLLQAVIAFLEAKVQ